MHLQEWDGDMKHVIPELHNSHRSRYQPTNEDKKQWLDTLIEK